MKTALKFIGFICLIYILSIIYPNFGYIFWHIFDFLLIILWIAAAFFAVILLLYACLWIYVGLKFLRQSRRWVSTYQIKWEIYRFDHWWGEIFCFQLLSDQGDLRRGLRSISPANFALSLWNQKMLRLFYQR